MFGWLALNSSTTFFSTSTCSGASPPPRQQNHRISVWPAWAVEAGSDAAPDAAALSDGAVLLPVLGALVALVPPQAPTTRANTPTAAMDRIARMCSSWSGTTTPPVGGRQR